MLANRLGRACWPTTRRLGRWKREFYPRRGDSRNWACHPRKTSLRSVRWKSSRGGRCLMTKNEESIMENAQAMVEAFHRMFEIVVQEAPALVDDQTRGLRIRLIHEEFEELKEAMANNDLVGIAKEMADLLYVVYGTAVSHGIDMDAVFREVHRSNMSKAGGYKREDGKWVKPATYSPAAIQPILAQQAAGQVKRGGEASDRLLRDDHSPVEWQVSQQSPTG